MVKFICGMLFIWFLLGAFIYLRDNKGGISIFSLSWDVILVILPTVPVLLLVEYIQNKTNK